MSLVVGVRIRDFHSENYIFVKFERHILNKHLALKPALLLNSLSVPRVYLHASSFKQTHNIMTVS